MNKFEHDKENQRFTLTLDDGSIAFVNYTITDDVMNLTYSEVPVVHRGRTVGNELVLNTFETLHKEGYKAKAICGYIRSVARRSEKWKDIIEH